VRRARMFRSAPMFRLSLLALSLVSSSLHAHSVAGWGNDADTSGKAGGIAAGEPSRFNATLWTFAQGTAAPKQPPKAKPAASRGPRAAEAKPPARRSSEPEVLTNESVMKMVSGGVDEATLIAKINSSAAAFTLDADSLIRLKSANVPSAVVRAMLNWKAPGTAAPAALAVPPAAPEPVVGNIVKDTGPALPSAAPAIAPPETPLTTVTARQGTSTFPLSDKPQSVLFVKSEAGTAKEAVVNVVLGDAGIQLITMGLSPMIGWNPYLGDTINKAARLGKGLLLNQNGATKGFEIETLTGSTADVTLKEGKVELLVPLNRYISSADMDPSTIEPVVLRTQPRDNEQRRVLSDRKVVLKQVKKGRFDLKPTTDRVESDVEQSLVPITVERMPNGVIKITTDEDLKRGEYALVFRKNDASSVRTANVPLKATPKQASAPAQAAPSAGAFPGMTPEMMGDMTPEQMAAMQQMQQAQAQPAQPRGGMFGGLGRRTPAAPPPQAPGADAAVAGFLAWDFRVLP